MATQIAPAPRLTRVPWMDRIRVLVIAGVVVAHAGTAYVFVAPWYYQEGPASPGMQLAVGIPTTLATIFGLGPLFMVAGWLSALSVARHGCGRFARSRLLRLGLPALVYLLLVQPFVVYLAARAAGRRISLGHLLTEVGGDRGFDVMWFVVALLVFSLAYAAIRRAWPAAPGGGPVSGRLLCGIAAAVAVADVCMWLRWSYAGHSPWMLEFVHWPQAAGMFTLGALAGERGWFERLPARLVHRCGRLAVAGLLALLALVGFTLAAGDLASTVGGWHWTAATFALLDAATAVALGVWVAGWSRVHWNGLLGPLGAAAGRASYATYFFHRLVLLGLAVALRPLAWPPETKFLVVAAVGVPASFLVGHLATRIPVANRVL